MNGRDCFLRYRFRNNIILSAPRIEKQTDFAQFDRIKRDTIQQRRIYVIIGNTKYSMCLRRAIVRRGHVYAVYAAVQKKTCPLSIMQ